MWQLAAERRQRFLPFVVADRPSCSESNAERAEISGAAGLFGASVHIGARVDFEADKTRGCYSQRDLSFQESTGNSTSPERDVFFGALRNGLLDQDVTNLEAPTRLEHACHLA